MQLPLSATRLPLVAGATSVGAPGSAYTVTVVLRAALVRPRTGSLCVAESVCLPSASGPVHDQLPPTQPTDANADEPS